MTVETVLFICIAAILALGLSFVQYFKKQRDKRVKHWAFFSVLRFITYFSVLLLFINPEFSQTSFSVEKPTLVLAVDNSTSMIDLAEKNSIEQFVSAISENEEIQESFTVERYTFGQRISTNDSLSFMEKQSDLNEAFSTFQKLYLQKNAPTVFISDGNQTYGQDYLYSAKQYQQNILPVVVGDTTTYSDLKLAQVNVNRFAFLNNKFPVEIFVNYEGEASIDKKLKIEQNNRVVFSQNLNFSKENASQQITALLTASSVGVKTYSIEIESLTSEKNTANNTKKFAVEIIDEKTNVLILSSILHPDLGMFKKSIEHNQQRSASIKFISDEIAFEDYQLIILYQPDSKFKEAYQKIEKLGLNTLTVTGTKTDYNFLNNQQTYFSKEANTQTENYLSTYNSSYNAYQFEDIGFDDFPPLEDKFGELQFSTEYQTLLFQRINGFQTETPLLATIKNNTSKHGFLFGENSWQWRAKSFRDQGDFKSYDEFLGKLIQYLASNKRRDRLNLEFDSFYNPGESIIFKANYVDGNYEFDPRAKISIQIKNSESGEEQLFPFLLKNNHYEVDLSNLSAGEYKFTVTVAEENIKKSGSFTIVDFDVEKQFLTADFDKLSKIASDNVYFLDKENELITDLLNNKAYTPVQKSKIEKSPLIDWYYLLAIIVLSLSIEWFLRKYNGLI
ncbi:VWA domain-containing protein [Mesonia maritima]|uniref:VWA domain-containing protein n=1 Tax=Mesonia maritima TaxID=1793873 RepID=A0ABU1K8W1_9FLAO|nr:VWA domain-containing protein [Mesonia maritima]MDR6301018.1 hypothetical protein [Mesonia maritima]